MSNWSIMETVASASESEAPSESIHDTEIKPVACHTAFLVFLIRST